MTQQDRTAVQYHKMTETPIPRLILSLAAPTILSMLITSIYNLADTFFVGRISYKKGIGQIVDCLLYTSPSPRDCS